MLGISIMRAGVFPRLTGIFILVGGILSPTAILGLNLIILAHLIGYTYLHKRLAVPASCQVKGT